MEKPVLATNIDGFLIKHAAFIEPHKKVWKVLIEKTGDASLSKWIGKKDYFIGVDEAMKKIMPKATNEERTEQVRRWYQEEVVSYIQGNPEIVNLKMANTLRDLKKKYVLALVTTNTKEYIGKILESAGIEDIYDIIYAIDISKKPQRGKLFESFLKDYGKPIAYVAGKNGERFDELKALGSITIYAPFDKFDEAVAEKSDKVVKTSEELVQVISQITKL